MNQLQKKSRRNSSRKNLRKSKRQSKKVSNKSNKRQNNRKNLGRKNKTSGGSRKNTRKQLSKRGGVGSEKKYKCTCVLDTGTGAPEATTAVTSSENQKTLKEKGISVTTSQELTAPPKARIKRSETNSTGLAVNKQNKKESEFKATNHNIGKKRGRNENINS